MRAAAGPVALAFLGALPALALAASPPASGLPPLAYKATKIRAAGEHTCAVLDEGRMKCWGHNEDGILGLEDDEHRSDQDGEMGNALPFVHLGTGNRAVAFSGGAYHWCALLNSGNIKCWGKGTSGMLGYGDEKSRGNHPGEMGDGLPFVDLGAGETAKEVASGDYHTCVALASGHLKCWGAGSEGALGSGNSEDRGEGPGEMGDNLAYVDLGTNRKVTSVAAGDYHTCVLLDDGGVKCFGDGLLGQLGYGFSGRVGDHKNEMGDLLPDVDLGTGRKAVKIGAGWYHSCALLDNNELKCFGYNGDGRLGTGDTVWHGKGEGQMGDNLPAVNFGPGRYAVEFSSGAAFNCAILNTGETTCWGEGKKGQLGTEDHRNVGATPESMGAGMKAVDFGSGRRALSVSCGDKHSCALLDDGEVKCWGENKLGQLGLESKTSYGGVPGTMGDNLPTVHLGTWPTSTATTTVTTSTRKRTTTTTTAIAKRPAPARPPMPAPMTTTSTSSSPVKTTSKSVPLSQRLESIATPVASTTARQGAKPSATTSKKAASTSAAKTAPPTTSSSSKARRRSVAAAGATSTTTTWQPVPDAFWNEHYQRNFELVISSAGRCLLGRAAAAALLLPLLCLPQR